MTKQTLLVRSENVSLYSLLDDNTPEEVKQNIDEIMNENIKYIREGCELRFDVCTYVDDVEVTLNITRKETNEEYAKRLAKEKAEKDATADKAKAKRQKEYLKLKAEFEGDSNGK